MLQKVWVAVCKARVCLCVFMFEYEQSIMGRVLVHSSPRKSQEEAKRKSKEKRVVYRHR